MRIRFYGKLWGLHGYQVVRGRFWLTPKSPEEIAAVYKVRADPELARQAELMTCGVNVP